MITISSVTALSASFPCRPHGPRIALCRSSVNALKLLRTVLNSSCSSLRGLHKRGKCLSLSLRRFVMPSAGAPARLPRSVLLRNLPSLLHFSPPTLFPISRYTTLPPLSPDLCVPTRPPTSRMRTTGASLRGCAVGQRPTHARALRYARAHASFRLESGRVGAGVPSISFLPS